MREPRLLMPMRLSAEWWEEYLDQLNRDTAQILFRDNRIAMWIALGASAFISCFWR